MSIRNIFCSRIIKYSLKHSLSPKLVGTTRNSHVVSYRAPPPPHSKATRVGAVVVGGAMWWWVIWHLWHEPDHITGEFDYPDPSKWTNAELGIPKE